LCLQRDGTGEGTEEPKKGTMRPRINFQLGPKQKETNTRLKSRPLLSSPEHIPFLLQEGLFKCK
jgi:hypothetical protein